MTFFKDILAWLFSERGYDLGIFILRVTVGVLMLTHGWMKIQNFSELSQSFANPIGIGSKWSLIGIIFAEFFCSLLLIFGLFTKLAAIPLIFGMVVAVFFTYPNFTIAQSEMGLIYLGAYVSIFFMGAGKYSLDHLLARWLL